jgi:hypothetical protein
MPTRRASSSIRVRVVERLRRRRREVARVPGVLVNRAGVAVDGFGFAPFGSLPELPGLVGA